MSNGGVLYTMFLFELYHHEVKLNSGRFENFDNTVLENQASFTSASSNRQFFAGMEFESFGHLVRRQVEWCAEMTYKEPQHWNLQIDPEHVAKIGVNFFFDDVTTAVSFKLLWS
jgi:hypothetical protein